MTKNLIIVESPTKTKTLKKFLGSDYTVEASMGHIRDLAKKDMGLGPGYEPHYVVLDKKKDVVSKLKKAAKKADVIYLAPDPDREGEAIAWHIAQVLGRDDDTVQRVTFNEITQRAVMAALANPRTIDGPKVDAQQTRRILDRLMGFRLSPLLWDKIKQGLSAGRVQSVALKMVCDRQDDIDAFVPEEYWILQADLEGAEPPRFVARLHRIDDKKAKVTNGDQAASIVEALKAGTFKVSQIERKESKQRPGPPFITSRLQQDAARRHGFTVKRTMNVAQGLYEGKEIGSRGATGLITYMRTDSTRVAQEALDAGREYIAKTYGDKALPAKPNVYRSKKGAQDAHEAIRPTNLDLPPDEIKKYLKPEEYKLYKLIWDRFVASQMLPAIFDVTRVDVDNGDYVLRATGKVLKSAGYLAVYREAADEDAKTEDDGGDGDGEGATMPELTEGETLKLHELTSEQKFTQPPAQYSEATLVKALEENGIGRPSTYASILSTLTDRDYVEKVEKRFNPLLLGRLVNTLLQGSFHEILNEGYTASLEEQLDEIEEGKADWKAALARFDEQLTRDLETAQEEMPDVKREGLPTDEICPESGHPLLLRFGRYGSFLGCSNYPECKFTKDPNATAEDEAAASETTEPCDKCGAEMALKRSRYGTFWGCTAYPECKNIRKTEQEKARTEPKPTGIDCPECGKGEIQEKVSRRGKVFYSCDRYPDCKYALWNKPVEEPCPDCDLPFVLEKTTKRWGTQHICSDKECGYKVTVEAPEDKPAPAKKAAGGKTTEKKAAPKKKKAKTATQKAAEKAVAKAAPKKTSTKKSTTKKTK